MDFKSTLEETGQATTTEDYDHGIDAPEGGEALETVHNEEAREHVDWASSAPRFEWKDEYGDVAPRNPEIEDILFGDRELRGVTGLDFGKLLTMHVLVESQEKVPHIVNFGDAGLHPAMLENIELCGYSVPTPIQQYCIPAILSGHDVMACAQTGSGKTAAFLIPILSKLMGKAKKLAAPRPTSQTPNYRAEPLVLILAPTRELATQIFDESRRFCYRTMLRPCVVYGGADIQSQRAELEKGCDLLVATPGRLLDFLERGRSLSLRRVKFAVIDEADEMMDMGFGPQIRNFFQNGDMNKDDDLQVTMFSATYPEVIQALAREFLSNDFIRLAVGKIGSTNRHIHQRILYVEEADKQKTLSNMLLNSPPSRTLIFCNHKGTVDTIDEYLYSLNFPCTSIHSGRTQREREDALRAFRTGRCPLLIATSVASRGLDIKNVMHVINYDIAQDITEYIHRIGRTARIGNRGLATTFYNEGNSAIAGDLVKCLVEAEQEVPDFLEMYKEDAEGQLGTNASVDELGVPINPTVSSGDGWGEPASSSWGMETNTTAAESSW